MSYKYLTLSEQNHLLKFLADTRDQFVDTIRPLNEEEWYKKPKNDGWTPAQCAEHIALVESFFLAEIKKILNSEAMPEKMDEVKGKNEMVVNMMLDRSVKIKGNADEDIPLKTIDKAQLIQRFLKHRDEVIDWLENTKEPLKVHFTSFPGIGLIDTYQYMLFISAHTERHTMQIKEVLEEQ